MNDEELLEWIKGAGRREAPDPELKARVLDSVAYRTRLEAPLAARRARTTNLALLTSALALVAAALLWLRAPNGASTAHITAEPGGATASHAASTAPPPVVDPCLARVAAAGSAPLVDDFEDGDDTIAPLEGRSGFWRWARESDAPGTAPALLPVPRPDSKALNRLALHVKGGQLVDWGATVEVNFRPPCYDASAFSGISVEARGPGRVFLSLREVSTIPPAEGGTCVTDCYNSHVAKLELTREWRTYRITWSELRQRGIGKPPLNPSHLHSIAFLIHPEDTPYDLWLDDVRFLTSKP